MVEDSRPSADEDVEVVDVSSTTLAGEKKEKVSLLMALGCSCGVDAELELMR